MREGDDRRGHERWTDTSPSRKGDGSYHPRRKRYFGPLIAWLLFIGAVAYGMYRLLEAWTR